ncbi:non-canonical purine NTP pyrophosphatase [Cellulosimicrobium marinum]|uniref:non-canonical purine NTP pyrophosphatase n=1 Tax=Cellulosimicrobium marinum TaxID=1638992 RepID=UPI001E46AB10|nr:non-canonical purine NTP pyrophosphatase [Cellulosimicrobium marinum]MCB7136418.1 non-canonical purine NTP pyrophosphatase [Cellulosimicrobium marinum]
MSTASTGPDAARSPEGARLVLATHNRGKIAELRAILAAELGAHPGVALAPDQVVGAGDVGAPEPVEDGVTFAENALIKARALVAATGLPAVADDSGLAVDVLGGAPGIFSARWAGRHGDDLANLELLLAQLRDVRPEHRGAAFVCAAALVTPDGREVVRTGEMRGVLLDAPRGTNGFGYDPILEPLEQPGATDGSAVPRRSAAELDPAEKNAISHRGTAFRALAPHVVEALAR